jgi:methionyl-tRNA synthetase
MSSDQYVVVVEPVVQENHLHRYNENIARFIRLTEAEAQPSNVLNTLKKYIKGDFTPLRISNAHGNVTMGVFKEKRCKKNVSVQMKYNHFIDLEAA